MAQAGRFTIRNRTGTKTAQVAGAARRALSRDSAELTVPLCVAYALLTCCVLAYVALVIARHGNVASTALNGWFVDGLELSASVLCVARSVVAVRGRLFALALGTGLLAWSLGNVFTTMHLGHSAIAADACFVAFYPLAYVAVTALMRTEVSDLSAQSWLDGATAGLGAAAVCAAFVFDTVARSAGGGQLASAMRDTDAIGDILLFALVVGGMAVLPATKRSRWHLLAGACAVTTVVDTLNVLHLSVLGPAFGATFNAIAWPVSILLLSMAVWLRTDAPSAARGREAGFVLPGLAAAAGLAILAVGSFHSMGRVALGLAIATLLVVGIRLVVSVGALRTLKELRQRQSMTDDLTGLANRRYLAHAFDAIWPPSIPQGAAEAQGACLFVDLNRFKEVNDLFGHAAGDQVLRQIGPRLAGSLRPTDTIVRLGGDEFAVVLPGAGVALAVDTAERLVTSLTQPFPLDILPIEISASIGIAVAPEHASDAAELLRCADAAMYRAKLSHRPYEVYERNLDDGADLLSLVEDLRRAIFETGELQLYFQPQLELRSGRISAVEALLRWPHPRLGMIAPLTFLPLAEEAGLMPAITEIVLDRAMEQCSRWRADGHDDLTVSVNVSASNLLDQDFVALVTATLERHGVPASSLVLEITETCMISDYERSREVIKSLRGLGIVTSVDDFGAGFTSLAYLGDLAVGELKLDRTFVTGLADHSGGRDAALVRSTIGLGHALGLRVVAEGIEDAETLHLLAEFDCDLVQGYLVSRPVAASDVELDTIWPLRLVNGRIAASG